VASREKIRIVEVGPRDGLQNENFKFSEAERIQFIEKLIAAGVEAIEVGAFVSPKWVPAMAGSKSIVSKLERDQSSGKISKGVSLISLVPNLKGMEDALECGAREIAVFTAASETFSKKNTNVTIDESFKRLSEVASLAKERNVRMRGYISTCFYCPFEGRVSEKKVIEVAERLKDLGVHEISIGDTIGAATPLEVKALFSGLKQSLNVTELAGHFHDTRGTALANILASLELGIRTFDSSLGGLGGCPYAPGATGNVATEDVVFMLEQMGFDTHLDLESLIHINKWMGSLMGRPLPSRVARAGLPKT
jgi:hydroxymethylglutaryl-CoA lyase